MKGWNHMENTGKTETLKTDFCERMGFILRIRSEVLTWPYVSETSCHDIRKSRVYFWNHNEISFTVLRCYQIQSFFSRNSTVNLSAVRGKCIARGYFSNLHNLGTKRNITNDQEMNSVDISSIYRLDGMLFVSSCFREKELWNICAGAILLLPIQPPYTKV